MTLLPTPLSKDIKDALNKQQFINECTFEYETTISKHFQHRAIALNLVRLPYLTVWLK